MPLISYVPGGRYNVLPNDNSTIGTTTTIPAVGKLAPVATGTLAVQPAQQYQQFGKIGLPADAGEVADALNALVIRIQQLEQLLDANPAYGIVST